MMILFRGKYRKLRATVADMPERIVADGNKDVNYCGFRVRSIRKEDLPEVMEMRRLQGVHDVHSCFMTFMAIDPDGIKVAETESGEIIGTCCAVKQHEDLYFVGIYCVREEFRGLGIGLQIWKACMDDIGTRNAALNAVPGTVEMYRSKSGFQTIDTTFTCIKNFTSEPVNPKNLTSTIPPGVSIEMFDNSHLPHIFQYDLDIMGFRRERLLELSCQEENSMTLVAFKNGKCVGFGSIKLSCLGAGKVGPLYADDADIAEVLLRGLILSTPVRSSFAMMTLSSNISSRKFLKKLDCPKREELTRMYKRETLDVNTDKVFALFNLNFAAF